MLGCYTHYLEGCCFEGMQQTDITGGLNMKVRYLGLCLAVGALLGVLITVPTRHASAQSTQQIEAAANTSSCDTSESLYSTCSLSVTWPTAFADTNYYYVCTPQGGTTSGDDGSDSAILQFYAPPSSKTTTGASFYVENLQGNIDHAYLNGVTCIAVHN